MTTSWMHALARHYEKMRRTFPNDKLLILFDIDGTILDMRHLVHYVLHQYDQQNGQRYFQELLPDDITVHENMIQPLLEQALAIPKTEAEKIAAYFELEAWSPTAMLEAHRPFAGVLDVIRWFQMQPRTYIGLNTGRLEALRADTLRSLNALGREYKVHFPSDMLFMNPNIWDEPVTIGKVSGIRYFQRRGYRLIAFIDNEPGNLEAVAGIDPEHEILLLHADTIFQSKRAQLPVRAVGGNEYNLADLITSEALPHHIQFVWYSISNEENLAQFLESEVQWGEADVRINPIAGDLILRRQGFSELALRSDETWLTLYDVLKKLRHHQKSIKLNLEAGGQIIGRIIELVTRCGFSGQNLWFNASAEQFQEHEFRQLALAYPQAEVQCPINFLAPMICHEPAKAKGILDMYRSWGIGRFSIGWQTPELRRLIDQMEAWGFPVDIYDVPDLEAFLRAVLLMPRSITSNFNFLEWRYNGAGHRKETSPDRRSPLLRAAGEV